MLPALVGGLVSGAASLFGGGGGGRASGGAADAASGILDAAQAANGMKAAGDQATKLTRDTEIAGKLLEMDSSQKMQNAGHTHAKGLQF